MSWCGSFWVQLVWDSLCFLDLHVYFLHQVREVFCHYFFKQVFNFLLSLFFFWHPHDVKVGMPEVVPKDYFNYFGFFFYLLFWLGIFYFLVFEIADFKILSLSLTFDILILIILVWCPLGPTSLGLSVLPGLVCLFPSPS